MFLIRDFLSRKPPPCLISWIRAISSFQLLMRSHVAQLSALMFQISTRIFLPLFSLFSCLIWQVVPCSGIASGQVPESSSGLSGGSPLTYFCSESLRALALFTRYLEAGDCSSTTMWLRACVRSFSLFHSSFLFFLHPLTKLLGL